MLTKATKNKKSKKTSNFKQQVINDHQYIKVVKEKERKMKWTVIVERSCLLQQARQDENNRQIPCGEQVQDLNYPRCDTSAALNTTSPHHSPCLPIPTQIIFILSVPVIILAIVSRFCDVLGIKSREFGDFNHSFNALNNECELRKSGLNNNKYCFGCGALTSHTLDTINVAVDTPAVGFKFGQICVGLAEFDNLESDLTDVLPPPATTLTNENEIQMRNKNVSYGPLSNTQAQTQTQHLTSPVIDIHDIMVKNGIESGQFDTIRYIFSGNMDGIGLQYDMFSGMFVFT